MQTFLPLRACGPADPVRPEVFLANWDATESVAGPDKRTKIDNPMVPRESEEPSAIKPLEIQLLGCCVEAA